MRERLASPESQPQRRPGLEAARSHVLIVDDHAPSRRVCAGYCDLFDHTTEMASGLAEAVSALRRVRFDVIVMNVHMAGADAGAALRTIRALPGAASETPVIGLTATDREDEMQEWLGAGLAGVLAKPVTAARLFSALSMVADSGREEARSWAPAA